MNEWNHFNPVRVHYAPDALSTLATYVPFQHAAVVTTAGFTNRGVTERIRDTLGKRVVAVCDDVAPNPDIQTIDAQAAQLRTAEPGCLIALGGGSVMDTAKALARLLLQPSDTTLTGHFRAGSSFTEAPALPVIAIPTTAGTGSEVTPFATVWDFERGRKHSVSGDDIYARTAVLDPLLTQNLPPETTIASGLDAVSHALESTWNHNATPVTLSLATASLRLSLSALPKVAGEPGSVEARGAMQQASLLAGMAISQTRTALAHSISYPLTASFALPHGIACSFTLPQLLRYNAEADDGRLRDLAHALGYSDSGALADGLSALFEHLDTAAIFHRYVDDPTTVLMLADRMVTPGRADNNLRAVDMAEVEAIVRASLPA